jgi:hypothetical protein
MNNLETIEEIAERVSGSVYREYSGRGMFGAKCLGVVCSDPTTAIEEAASLNIRGARQDNMGRDYIVYWPHLKD